MQCFAGYFHIKDGHVLDVKLRTLGQVGPTTTAAQFDLTVKHTNLKNRIMQYDDDGDDDDDDDDDGLWSN